jgi:glucose/arabinose dehydrogenase
LNPMRRLAVLAILVSILRAAPDGAELYKANCAMCHGPEGLGMTGVFPPLAKSDFLSNHREKALRGPMEGLSGEIEVNGQTYRGGMPAAFLDDEQLTAVFNHIFTSWGNNVPPATLDEIRSTRAKTKFPTLDALKASMAGSTLPEPPAGWKLSIAEELGFSPTRLALHPDGKRILILSMHGDVWSWSPGTPGITRLFHHQDFIDPTLGSQLVMGMTVDRRGRLYLTSNQCNKNASPVRNEMILWRTEAWSEAHEWSPPKSWLRTSSPFGIGPYNHGLSHIAQGPDGMIYVNSGARTDSGEAGTQPNYATTGEDPITAAIWRIDPEAENPEIEVIARGLRNTYGFAWDDQQRLLGVDNGPDAHCAEELNLIEPGKHYGFPYQHSNWTEKPYPHTPTKPKGLELTPPFKNLGPDAGQGLFTFEAHSSPAGFVWLGKDWPQPFGGSFLTVRFGNLLKIDKDVGFDLVQLHPDFEKRTVVTKRILHPLARPIDLLKLPGHRLLIAEHSRATNFAAGTGTPGRLLLLESR